jgi:hypothetical protein
VGKTATWLLRAKGSDDALLRSKGLIKSADEARAEVDNEVF